MSKNLGVEIPVMGKMEKEGVKKSQFRSQSVHIQLMILPYLMLRGTSCLSKIIII